MTKKELLSMLERYPDDTRIYCYLNGTYSKFTIKEYVVKDEIIFISIEDTK